jgi:hypothetical protein
VTTIATFIAPLRSLVSLQMRFDEPQLFVDLREISVKMSAVSASPNCAALSIAVRTEAPYAPRRSATAVRTTPVLMSSGNSASADSFAATRGAVRAAAQRGDALGQQVALVWRSGDRIEQFVQRDEVRPSRSSVPA